LTLGIATRISHARGVARSFVKWVEEVARASDLRRLYTEASITARAVFEKAGFRVIVAQTLSVHGEHMMNYRTEKRPDFARGGT
jgi:putative acetyltransferase